MAQLPIPTGEVILEWDVASWMPALEYWNARLGDRPCDRGLELGAGHGGVSLWLATRCREVVCSDLWGPTDEARRLHASQRCGNVSYEEIDATAIPYRNEFDVIVFRSVIGAVAGVGGADQAKQRRAMGEIHAALRPGGLLLFAENLEASPIHHWLRRRFNPWAVNWRYPTLDEMRAFLGEFRQVEIRSTGVVGLLGRTEGQRRVLAGADRAVLNAVVPARWKYIAYGSAVK